MDQVIRVVAIGSPHGDDQAAWRVAELLRDRVALDVNVVVLSDPSGLLDDVGNCDVLMIVDACQGSGSPGTITRLDWPDERICRRRSHSTHGIGIADALQIADKLGRLPRRVMVFGIEVQHCEPGLPLSTAVENAIDELPAQILLEINSPRGQK